MGVIFAYKVFSYSQGCLITFSESSFIECMGAEPLHRCVSEMIKALDPSSRILRITPSSKKNKDKTELKELVRTFVVSMFNSNLKLKVLSAYNGNLLRLEYTA